MQRLWFIALIIGFARPVLAANDALVWGHIRSNGFVFVGKPESIRDQCLVWMAAHRIRTVSSAVVRGEEIFFSRLLYAPEACLEILGKGEDLGSPQQHRTVFGEVRRYPFTFTGLTSTVVVRCASFLNRAQVQSADSVVANGREYPAKYRLYGTEICGEIATRAKNLPEPFKQFYISGSAERNGFVFVGHRELFMDQCQGYWARARLTRVRQYRVGDEGIDFPHAVDKAPFCESAFSHATEIKDTQARYSAVGAIRNQRFWFVGTALSFLSGCDDWMRAENIRQISEILIQGKKTVPRVPWVGSGACGAIFSVAQSLSTETPVILVAGRVNDLGYAFSGSEERFRLQCQAFLKQNHIGAVSGFTSGEKAIALTEAIEGGALCQAIAETAALVIPPLLTYSISGTVNADPFWFLGRADEIIAQCASFLALKSASPIGSFLSEGKTYPVEPVAVGAEACPKILAQAKPVADASRVFVGGAIGRTGFSFATSKASAQQECVQHLQGNGVTSASSFRVFDRVFPTPVPLGNPVIICQELLRMGAEYKTFPTLDLKGSVVGNAFSFQGPLDEVNTACKAFVESKSIEDAPSVTVNGTVAQAPGEPWRRHEICSVLLRFAARGSD